MLLNILLLNLKILEAYWQWNLQEIRKKSAVPIIMVEFMVGKMQKLPKSTQNILSLAACIGGRV